MGKSVSVRYLSLVPECIFLFLDVSVVCPNNITFNQKLYFYINLLKYVQCLVYVMMSEKRTCPLGTHRIQVEKNSSKSINKY